jgi:parallel beta-helix repeat protein
MNRKPVLILSLTLLIGILGVAFSVQRAKASGTIYIRADGSIDPSTASISTVDNVTYILTGNITCDADGIVVERNNTILDGAGYTIQGTEVYPNKGIFLANGNNITTKNTKIRNFYFGIYLNYSSHSSIVGNNMANNDHGIYLDSSSNNSIVGNNISWSSRGGIRLAGLSGSSDNNVSENNITNNLESGIEADLSDKNNNSISGNNITANGDGIRLFSSFSTVSGNSLIANSNGIVVSGYSNIVSENNITANEVYGIELSSQYLSGIASNTIAGNNITDNSIGIDLQYSSGNSIVGNYIMANNRGPLLGLRYSQCGIWFFNSSNNRIHHNDFIANTHQIVSEDSLNVWDDGYPSGGNYWSDYNGTDANYDGIGDTPYVVGVNNTDHYPLVGMFNSYNVTYYTPPLVPHACNITVISNSTISDFVAPIWIEHPEVIFFMFNASGTESSTGFCRVSFPTAMMNGTYHVSVNGTETPYNLLPCSDANHSYLYFTYSHSTEQIIIVPEFPSILILPLFMMATLLAVAICRKKRAGRR